MSGNFSFFEWFNAFAVRGQRDLSGPAVKVAIAIARHANASTGIAEPGQRRISDSAGDQNLGRIRKALTEVVASGWILIINKGGGRLNTSQYQLAIPAAETGTTFVPESDQQTGTHAVPDSVETGTTYVPVNDTQTGTQDVPISAETGTEAVPVSAENTMPESAVNGDVIEHKRGRKTQKRGTYTVPGRAKKGLIRKKQTRARGAASGVGGPKPAQVCDETPEFPGNLQTDAFRTAWGDWIRYRQERNLPKLTSISVSRQITKLSRWGEQAAIAAIDESISNQWQGLFPPKNAPISGASASAIIATAQSWDDVSNSQLPPELRRKNMPKEYHYREALKLAPTRPDEQFLKDHPDIAAKGVPLADMQAAWDEAFAWQQSQSAQQPAEVGV